MPEAAPRCSLLRSAAELQAFQAEWIPLWQLDPAATPFSRPEWLIPWWSQFGTGEMCAAVVRDAAGEPIAFLPFYLYVAPESGERQLQLLGVGTTDYLDGLFAPLCRSEDLRAALRLMCDEVRWDVLHASQLRPSSLLAQLLGEAESAGATTYSSEACSRMPASEIAGLPVRIRRNAMYYRNAAQRRGSLELVAADASSAPEAFEELVRLHTERWQGRGEAGVLADPLVLAWHREAIPQLAAAGLLRLMRLRLAGETIAVLYALVDPPDRPDRVTRTEYLYLTAFATAARDLRPGTLLLAYGIEAAAHEGVRTIDMLRGGEAYKSLWHVEPVTTLGFSLPRHAAEQMLARPFSAQHPRP